MKEDRLGLVRPESDHPFSVRRRVAALDCPSPKQIDEHLARLGYRGQAEARRAISVLAYRHVRRLQRLHLCEVALADLPGRDAFLLLGPTGCGKTHLVELVFREILQVPTVVVDITQFSETGYVGHDPSTVLTRLVDAAGGDTAWAGCGVVCLDEFDKLAGSSSSARFAGAATTKDVSGWGVQRSLLTLLSAPSAEYAPDHGFSGNIRSKVLSLGGVSFLACGAFSGLRMPQDERSMGFGATRTSTIERPSEVEPSALERYGFMPELLGRFTRVVELTPLGRTELESILLDVLRRHRGELEAEGLDLALPPEALAGIVDSAIRRGHGARGLRAAVTRLVEDIVYEGAKGAHG